MPDAGRIAREAFGTLPDGRAVERVVLRGTDGLTAHVISYGAALQALMVPDAEGRCEDIVLGYDDLDGYVCERRFFGATVGRYANRIANASFVLEGKVVRLAANDGPHALHGGPDGFDRQLWQITDIGDAAQPYVTLAYVSDDGEQGYPGRLDVSVTYRLTHLCELSVVLTACSDRPTIANLTNHSFFNLEGAASGVDVLNHRLAVAAEHFLAIDDSAIPLPEPPRGVAGTPFDFRTAVPIGARIRHDDPQLRHGRGYDHNFCLKSGRELKLAARLEAPKSGRILKLFTDQAGLQVYSGNYLDGAIAGKGARLYRQSDAICLEPQTWPDAPNRADFPSPRLVPGSIYRNHIVYHFARARSVTVSA